MDSFEQQWVDRKEEVIQLNVGSYFGDGFLVRVDTGSYYFDDDPSLKLTSATIEKILLLLRFHAELIEEFIDTVPEKKASSTAERRFWALMDDAVEGVKRDLPSDKFEITAVLSPVPDPF